MGASTNHSKTKTNGTSAKPDAILDALREQAGDEAPFAASSAALAAVNSVMLANMRTRLGGAAPTPSPIHASAAAQMHTTTAVGAIVDAEQTPIMLVDIKKSSTTIAAAEAETIAPVINRDAPTATDFMAAPSPILAAPILISPAAERRESRVPSPATAAASENDYAAPPKGFGLRTSSEKAADIAMSTAPQAETAEALEIPSPSVVDTQDYQAENDATYRDWQSTLPPAQRQWHRLAIAGVLVAAIAVNLFFFVGSGPQTPIQPTTGIAPVQTIGAAPDAASAQPLNQIAIPTPAEIQASAAIAPRTNPPRITEIEAEARTISFTAPSLEISNQLSMPNQAGPVPNRLPPVVPLDAEAEAIVSPPASRQPSRTLNPQELLRVLSRP